MLALLCSLFLTGNLACDCGCTSEKIQAQVEQNSSEILTHPYQQLDSYIQEVSQGKLNPYTDLEGFMRAAKNAVTLLPEDVQKQLNDFKLNKREDGYLYFKGLPTDVNLAKTPGDGYTFPPVKDSFVSEFMLSVFSSALGEPFNYIQEEKGNIFRNVRPTKYNAFAQTSDGSKVDLELHTETAFHWFKPDYLLLNCLRGDRSQKAYTLVSSLKKIVRELDPETIEELRKPQYRTGIDVSFGNRDKSLYCDELIPVLYGTDGDTMITYDLDLMVGLTSEAKMALVKLKEAIIKVQEAVLLEPGDILIVDNKRAIHGRTAYDAFFDGYDRWLQRVYVSKDEAFAENIPSSGRVITYEFK